MKTHIKLNEDGIRAVREGWGLRQSRGWADEIAGLYRALRKGREENKDEPGAADFYYGEMEMRRRANSGSNFEPPRLPREMNRKPPPKSIVEQAVLTLYWLVSGYALRAGRALVTLGLVLLVAAAIFTTIGFKPPERSQFVPVRVSSTGALLYQEQPVLRPSGWHQFRDAFLYSFEVATSLLRPPNRDLYTAGRLSELGLRLLGPVLFGLAILSLRGRVKR
jgi:hypothetical protein